MKNSGIKSCLRPTGTTGLWDWGVASGYLAEGWIDFGKPLFGTNFRLFQGSKWTSTIMGGGKAHQRAFVAVLLLANFH